MALLGDRHWIQPDVFPDAYSRDVGDAAAHLHVRRRHGLDASQPARNGRRIHSRHRVPAFLRQHFQKSDQPGRAGARRSMGRSQPRMVHSVAAAYMSGQAPSQPQPSQPLSVEDIHMPAPSIFPLVLSLGVGVIGLGLIIDWYRIMLIGAAVTVLSIIGMGFEYADFGEESHDPEHAPSSGGVDVRKIGLWSFID